MTTEAQGSLFGEGRMTPPQRSSTPDPDAIRRRLGSLLAKLQSADEMPFSDRDARMWTAVVPTMTKWLPDAEAQAVRAAFAREMERLKAPLSFDQSAR